MNVIAILFLAPSVLTLLSIGLAFIWAARIQLAAESDYVATATPNETAAWIEELEVDLEWEMIAATPAPVASARKPRKARRHGKAKRSWANIEPALAACLIAQASCQSRVAQRKQMAHHLNS